MSKEKSRIGSLRGDLARLWTHLGRRRKTQFFLLLALMFVGAIAEVVSLGMVLPFIGALTAPERILSHPELGAIARALGITVPSQLLLPLAVAFSLTALLAGATRLALQWASTRFSNGVGIDLSVDIYSRTLHQPYQVHVARNSSEVVSGITLKTGAVVSGALVQILMLVSAAVLLLFIVTTLLLIDPFISLVSFGSLGGAYFLMTLFSQRKLLHNGAIISEQQTKVVQSIQEGLGGVRDILLDGTQTVYIDSYHAAERKLRYSMGSNTLISASPRFVIEALAMVLIAVLAYMLSASSGSIGGALPTLGVLALGAQRMLPLLQQGYSAWTKIAGYRAMIADTLVLLEQPMPTETANNKKKQAKLPFESTIRLQELRFRYGSKMSWVLDGVTLIIPKGSRVGFVGITGSGKSTLVDLIMGLLVPVEGVMYIDDIPITAENRQAWQRNVAHVPQDVYLSDSSIAENIAFGCPVSEIDMARVRDAARQAQIADFIETLPEGYHAKVGERGVRLSGGQCQRIGIARALYKNATVLVFDEATSALDTQTEKAVMDSINALDKNLTILIIAHRLGTVQGCDVIFEIDQARVAAQGTYEELWQNSSSFRAKALSH